MKKISYIICLTAILCSCNNELPIENVQELQTPKSKEDSEILSFKNSEEFLSTIENFDLDNPILTRASSSFRNDLSWNGGGYRVKETFLRYYRNIVFSIKIKGDKTTPGADLGDNDFVGKPEIVSCEAIVYTKDGDGWIGAKIEKK